jgi:Leucine-rich repeat (LRR) protein
MEEGMTSDDSTPTPQVRRNLESLKKEAKRWLDALRSGDADARARLRQAYPDAPTDPGLRDVQLALAREHGFPGWAALKDAVASRDDEGRRALALYETKADALLEAYRTGTPEAMERHYRHTWHRRAWPAMRRYVQLDLGKRSTGEVDDVDITLDDARHLVALEHQFANWDALKDYTKTLRAGRRLAAKPVVIAAADASEEAGSEPIAISRDWDEVIALLAANAPVQLGAMNQMTDEILADIAKVDGIVGLRLNGSRGVTDEGLRHLAGMMTLKRLDISGTAITDRGLEVLRHLPALEILSLAGTAISDAGARELAHCHALVRLDLSWTRTGDGAICALAGKRALTHLTSGVGVTDAGIPWLHELPVFKSWQGGDVWNGLTSYDSEPNHLNLRGPFSDRGMQQMRGLDGLAGLNLDDSHLGITAAALAPLVSLPNLTWLGVDAKDDWMPYIAQMPALRFLGIQDTVAGDDGFVALGRSQTIERIWGRRCHNLRSRGFRALAHMPRLRGLSVSCLNVDDSAIATLPTFPSLIELMPMDIPDAGYRHIGKCERLESLVLMYCRDTTDAATEHITGLKNLKSYFNSYTTITDRTPELLSTMDSLEGITFDTCHYLTNAGVARLARLPRLKKLHASGGHITSDVARPFRPEVKVTWGG